MEAPMGVKRHPLFAGDENARSFPSDEVLALRLEHSLVQLGPHAAELTRIFYERLFAARPELRRLFPSDMTAQREKLAATLWAVVGGLDQPATARARLTALGRDHVAYGARPEHYPIVCEKLLESLVEVAGDEWDAETIADWRTALERIAAVMIEGTEPES
jgi:hemoglobin-like flavoprotein